MNRVLPIVAVCLSLLAFAIALVPRGDVAPPPVTVNAPAANDEELDFLRRRVELLEDDNRTLWTRVTQLERQPMMASGDGGGSPALAAELEKLRAELHSVMVGDVANSEAGRTAIRDLIREAQSDAQRDRMVQLEERRAKQAEQTQARWKEFATNANLSSSAQQKLTERLAFEESERSKKMEQLRLGESTWQEVSQYLRMQRKETDEAVTSMMDDSQRQQYQQLRRSDGSTLRGGDRGGNGEGARGNPFQNGFQRGGKGGR